MKVAEAIKELKKLPNDAEIYLVKDWEHADENGNLSDLYRLGEITYQVVVVEDGMDWKDETEVLLGFEEQVARAIIEKNW